LGRQKVLVNKMVNEIKVKSILNKHKKRDDWFLDDYSVNPYSGCSFNCIYCYIRGSKYGELDIKRFFALDDYYDSDRRAYHSALKSVNQKTGFKK